MKKIVLFAILVFLISSIKALKPSPTESFPNELILSAPDLFYLYWKHDNVNIIFEIHFKNSKWALFGINGPSYSDVIVGWMNDDQTGHFSDQKLTTQNNQNLVNLDQNQNWLPLEAFKKDEYTVLKFKRDIKLLCNDNLLDDLDINPGMNNLIFSYGNSYNPKDASISIENLNQIQVNLLVQSQGPFNCKPLEAKQILISKPTENYLNQIDLIEGIYRLYWNYTKTDLLGEIHVKTQGWIGFGLSPNGGMDKSDVMVAWISNGVTNFTDRFIYNREVRIDKNQNWNLLFSSESNGVTIIKFKRPIKLCDSDDKTIEEGSPYVIFAFGLNDPAPGQDISYHLSNRGSKKLNLISVSENREVNVPDAETLDLTMSNIILPKQDTYYYCKGFQVPKSLTQKRHIFKYELILPKINYKNMHHALLYECVKSYNGTNPPYPDGGCYTNEIKYAYCQLTSLAWAVGGQEYDYYPKDTGYPIGGDTDYSFLVLELHYDNPEQVLGFIDKLTLRFHMTKTLRKHELGMLTVGSESSPFGIALPPGMDYIPLKYYCVKDCMDKNLKDQNITIVSAIPHTHLTGVDIYTKIVRNGVDIGYLHRNKYYDFDYQNSYLLNPFVTLAKGDELITHCGYKTTNRKTFTLGGFSTHKEMCLHFLTYYPRNNFKTCMSVPYPNDYIELLTTLNKTGVAQVPTINLQNVNSIYEAIYASIYQIDSKPITDNVKNLFLNMFNKSRITAQCGDFSPGPYNQIKPKNEYIENDVCRANTNSNNQSFINVVGSFIMNIFNFLFGWIRN